MACSPFTVCTMVYSVVALVQHLVSAAIWYVVSPRLARIQRNGVRAALPAVVVLPAPARESRLRICASSGAAAGGACGVCWASAFFKRVTVCTRRSRVTGFSR